MNSVTNRAQGAKNNTFEDQLTASARRLREAQDAKLQVTALPQSHRRLYWGWIATPTAAAIGLLIGLFVHRPAQQNNDFVVPVVAAETTGHSILDDGTDYSLFVAL